MQEILGGAALFLVFSAGVPQARAMEILWIGSGLSGFNSSEMSVVNEAINQWEHLIFHNNTTNNRMILQISKTPLSSGILGKAFNFSVEAGTNSPISAGIQINQNVSWYVDPTPALNDEYNPTILDDYYFIAKNGSGANGRYDMLSVVLHEIGHTIGFARAYSDWIALNQLAMGLHLIPDQSHADPNFHLLDFMSSGGLSTSERKLISDLDLTALARAFDYKLTPDIDRDYDVDTADLTKMLQNFSGDVGASGNLTHKSGDLDADGDVDTADLTFALQQFTGASSAPISNSLLASDLASLQEVITLTAGVGSEGTDGSLDTVAIPEPASLVLLSLGLVGLVAVCRRPKIVGR